MDLTVADQGGATTATSNTIMRDYRKGNWNLQETMTLIEAKKMGDERRMRRLGKASGGERGKTAELRWKWVEDYCCRKGCLRSQNQCNDKWDNLMRDFKKVREYERRRAAREGSSGGDGRSYWRIEKNERKEHNLPSNMLPQVYEALVEVVERKGPPPPPPLPPPPAAVAVEKGGGYRPPLIAPPSAAEVHGGGVPSSLPLPTVDSDTNEYSGSPAKRRKWPDGAGEGTSGGGTLQELGAAISESASAIAEALRWGEEREERRHGEMLSMHERRLRAEESKAEINRQGIDGLVDAINKLANSIFALAAANNPSKNNTT